MMRSLTLLCSVACVTACAVDAPYRFPKAIVPYVADAPPKIDGIIEPAEYRRLAAITGMVTWGGAGGGLKTVVPKMQQVVWYLGYDDQYFYISMHSPNPPGIWPLARTKQNDNGSILWDDHTEIQISKERARATFPGVGFYKVMANGRGFFTDEWFYNGTPGTEGEWSIAGPLKCSVTKEHWDLEIAIDLRAFEEKRLDGKTWVLQLLRADKPGGIYFAGWVGESWMSWGQFGEVTFDRTAPVFRFPETGELAKGNLGLVFETASQTPEKVPVKIRVTVTDGNGKAIFDEVEQVEAGKQLRQIRFESALPLTPRGNWLEVLATYPDAEGIDKILYHVRAPIIKLTPEYHAQHIAPWLEQRPKGDFVWNFAYWPSYGVAKTSVDVDFFGIKDELVNARSFRVSVSRRGQQKPIASGQADLRNRYGEFILKGLALPEGEYAAKVDVLGADGKTAVGTRAMDFVRRRYEWEGNQLGTESKVLEPYTPIKVQGKVLEVWGRKYTLGADGLLAKIVAGGGAGPEDILTGPMRWIGMAGSRDLSVTEGNARVTIEQATPARVDIKSTGRLGAAKYELEAFLEYDGWYQARLTLSPLSKDAFIEFLCLHVPLWDNADTMYMQRGGDGLRGNKFGALPEGTGRIWDSSELLPLGNWGSFCPIVFVGTGDKGFWWFAEQNRSWTMSDEMPAVDLKRGEDGLALQFNILAGLTTLTEPRTIEFAILIDPVKQIPDERKWGWGQLRYAHNTYGYRYYGRSVDGYEATDEDLAELTRMITDPNWKLPAKVKDDYSRRHVGAFRNRYFPMVGQQGLMLTLYGSTSLTGLGLPAFDTYGGEWLRRTNWSPSPQTEFKNRWNIPCTHQWKTPRELTTVGVNFTRSYEDCFVWHHRRLLSKVPFNGTWWDNRSLTVIEDYDPARGEFYHRFNVFTRRRLMKRLCTMGWELGRRPWWINNMHVDWGFCQVAWHIENDFYVDNADLTMMEQLPVDVFRALCRIKRGVIHRLAARGPEGSVEQIRRMGRSQAGMCLLHDIGSYLWGFDRHFAPGMLKILDETVGFFDGAEFVPYWRNQDLLRFDAPGVQASLYRGRGKAVAVVVNSNREDVDVPFQLGPILGKRRIQRIHDAETGFAFAPQWDAKIRKRVLGELKPRVFGMPRGGVRLLVIE